MESILNNFKASMERIRNNFYISFLSINFINKRPFYKDTILDVDIKENVLKFDSLNKIDIDTVQEYGNSIRRHFLNDIVITYEVYSTSMYLYHTKKIISPALVEDRNLHSSDFENLKDIYSEDEKIFFVQLRRLRNSIVHFNGVYSKTNKLDYTFYLDKYNSEGFEGQSISIKYDSLIWIYEKTKEYIEEGNKKYKLNYKGV